MTSVLEWQGMQNKQLPIMAIFLTVATVVYAQENTSAETPSKSVAPADAVLNTGTAPEESAATARPGSPESGDAAVTSTESEANESLTATDDYRATERISEDRSVSFPVDI